MSLRTAALARLIRDTISAAFAAEGEYASGSLHAQLEGFRRVLIHDRTSNHKAEE